MTHIEQVDRIVDALASSWMTAFRSSKEGAHDLLRAKSLMDRSTAIVHGRTVACSAVPRLFDATAKARMRYACETMHAILKKTIAGYCADPSFRTLFPFDSRTERLIVDSFRERTSLPFVRYDIFLDEQSGDFVFCELNADGASGMNEDREIARALRATSTFERFSRTYHVEENELVDSLIDTFIDLANLDAIVHPSIAICDYLENATMSEFEVYQQAFLRRGISCEICDVRSLITEAGALRLPDGRRIDAVWRRCVASDLIAHWDESVDIVNAMRSETSCILGDFSGLIVHDKRIFHILHLPETQKMLSASERSFVAKHVPRTLPLDSMLIDITRLKSEKDLWVIKPADGYGAKGVHLGIDCDAALWETLVDSCVDGGAGRPFVAQEFHAPFRTLAAPLDTSEKKPPLKPYANLLGLYAYDGHFAGTFARLGPENIVSGLYGGLTAATFWVDCERPKPRSSQQSRTK